MIHRIAVVSDTHGLMRPEVIDVLDGVELILPAGDVGTRAVLDALRSVAPVRAIRGNVDKGDLLNMLPVDDVICVADHLLYLLHDRAQLGIDPSAAGAGFDAVITGHSHKPLEERSDEVLYLNPGSIGPRRFSLPISMAWLLLDSERQQLPVVEFQSFPVS